MSLFSKNPQGGIMDTIRCDETEFLIWKWHPEGAAEGEFAKENAIRWGSSLRVKNGEAAVFVYHSEGQIVQEYITGPYDSILKTENLPLITSALGLLYNGNTPFQAELYFVNLAEKLQTKVGVPYFDVADPRFPDRGVPTSVRGVINFKIEDIQGFIKNYQLRTISIEEFRGIIKAAATKYVKTAVANAPDEYGIPVTQLEKKILDINEIIENYIKKRLLDEFGVSVTSVDISDIEIDKSSPNYKFLVKKTDIDAKLRNASKVRGFVTETASQVSELATDVATASADVKEYKYAKHKKSQIGFVKGLFKGDGDLSAGESKPKFSTNIPKGIIDGIGSKFGKKEDQAPPPIPSFDFHVAVDGQDSGSLDYDELTEYVKQGKLTPNSLVWKKGMESWVEAQSVPELKLFFEEDDDETPPPIPKG